jgi:hypothetical protein
MTDKRQAQDDAAHTCNDNELERRATGTGVLTTEGTYHYNHHLSPQRPRPTFTPPPTSTGQHMPTRAHEGTRQPAQVHRRATTANAGPRGPTTAVTGQRRPTTDNTSQRKPKRAHDTLKRQWQWLYHQRVMATRWCGWCHFWWRQGPPLPPPPCQCVFYYPLVIRRYY